MRLLKICHISLNNTISIPHLYSFKPLKAKVEGKKNLCIKPKKKGVGGWGWGRRSLGVGTRAKQWGEKDFWVSKNLFFKIL